MKIRTVRYIFKEGFLNAYRNKLMSLASISIMVASLLVFGMFFFITVNLEHNLGILKQQPAMVVFCNPEIDDTQVKQVEDQIKNNGKVQEYKVVSKKEAFEKYKELLSSNKDLLVGFDESITPISFTIKLKNPQEGSEVIDEFKKINGVDEVRYSLKTIEFINNVSNWVHIVSIILIVILLVTSMFIISNTIKLTVFARRKEINIMKYIGATDWFIRWPFIVEGVIIGFVGALVSLIITSYGYNIIEGKFNTNLVDYSIDFIKLVSLSSLASRIIIFYSVIGISVGALGSFMSIRKYLRV